MARPFLVPFRRLLRLAGSRWRYSTPPPHGLEVTHTIRNNFCMALNGLHCSGIWINIGKATLGRNFNVTTGRVAWDMRGATWNFGTNSAFVLGPRKTTENLDRVGWSQDLPDANRLLTSSPALKYASPNVRSYLCCCLSFMDLSFCVHILDQY
jgi:hypothetical protein